MILDKHHLILYGVVAAGLFLGSYLYADWKAQVADTKVQAAQVVLAEARQSNALLAQQIQQQAQAFAQERASRDAQSALLISEISKRDAALVERKKAAETLTLPQAGERWSQLLGLAPGELLPLPDGRLAATLGASRLTVSALEDAPVLRQDLAAVNGQLKNEKQTTAGLDAQVGEQKKLIIGKDAELAAAGKACDARIGQVKAQSRKSKSKWFGAGVVVGFLGRTLLGR